VAASLGYITLQEAQTRVTTTLRALTGRLAAQGFRIPRQDPSGWLPTFFDSNTGSMYGSTDFSTDSTAFNTAGVLFAKTFFERTDPGSTDTHEISQLADELFASVDWPRMFCIGAGATVAEKGKSVYNGTAFPWLLQDSGTCTLSQGPATDGLFYFSEMIWLGWLAHVKACGGEQQKPCKEKAIERMWAAMQGRRHHPNFNYAGHALLTDWPSYVVQVR
jgi:hypothetical protein